MNDEKAVILIPAYQPKETLLALVQQLLKQDIQQVIEHIIIVNDGSDANPLFAQLSEFPKVSVLSHAINLGKGAALKTGFNHILLQFPKVRSIVTADADGQHLPHDILNIVNAALKKPSTLILGVRTFSQDVPLRSLVGNQVTRLVARFFTGLNLADTQTGLRAWPVELARQVLKIRINGYDFEMECLVRGKELVPQLSLQEVPIQTVYEEGNKTSHFNPFLDSMRIYFVFLRYCGAGLLTALTDNMVFIFAYLLSGNMLTSQILSRSCGALVSFVLGIHVVFRSTVNPLYALLKFILLVFLFGLISYGFIQFLNQAWGINVFVSKILAELILFVASFAIQRNFIFRQNF